MTQLAAIAGRSNNAVWLGAGIAFAYFLTVRWFPPYPYLKSPEDNGE